MCFSGLGGWRGPSPTATEAQDEIRRVAAEASALQRGLADREADVADLAATLVPCPMAPHVPGGPAIPGGVTGRGPRTWGVWASPLRRLVPTTPPPPAD